MQASDGNRDGVWIGVDVGGTKVLAAVVDDTGRVIRSARRATPGRLVDVAQLEQTIVSAVEDVAGGEHVDGIGVAAAGFVSVDGRRVMFAPHLPWRGHEVRDRLEQRFGAATSLDNDANCAALGEWRFGAARGASSAIVITMGTGIGGAILIDGRLIRGANGMAGEFGHMQVVADGHACECGRSGCWEQYSSGNALVRAARARMLDQPSVLAEVTGGNPEQVTGPMVTEAAESGDLVARLAFSSVGDWLGVGVANLVAALDPEVVVVGGGVSAAGDRLLEPARNALQRSLVGGAHRDVPPIVPALLGPEAGVVGGTELARRSGRVLQR